jgi:hypothetical protein
MVVTRDTDAQFQEKLEKGQQGEQWTLNYTCRTLHYVNVPLSKIKEKDSGPRIYIPDTDGLKPFLVPVPDTLCMFRYDWRHKEQPILPSEFWLESKRKSKCSFYRINKAWQSGIDAWCRKNYLHVEKVTGKPVWIFHLIFPTSEEAMNHQGVPPQNRPAPEGLYAHPVSLPLAYDPSPYPRMVYWKIEDMLRLASVEEVLAASEGVN